MAMILYLQADNNIKITGLSDADTAAYLNSATVTYAIKNEAGSTITGATGTLDYIAASNGNYLGVVDATVMVLNSTTPFTLTGNFFIEITIVQGNYNDFRVEPATVAYRS